MLEIKNLVDETAWHTWSTFLVKFIISVKRKYHNAPPAESKLISMWACFDVKRASIDLAKSSWLSSLNSRKCNDCKLKIKNTNRSIINLFIN